MARMAGHRQGRQGGQGGSFILSLACRHPRQCFARPCPCLCRQPDAAAAGIPQGKRAFFRKEFVYTYRQKQCFLRSKTLTQDSTLGPNCHAIRACPAAFPPPFLFPESAPSAEMMPVHHQEDAAAIALASACWHRQALALCRRLLTSSAWREAVDARRQG